MDQYEGFFGRKPRIKSDYYQQTPLNSMENRITGDNMEDEDEDEDDLESENLEERKSPVKKNPSSSEMSIRGAKRIWFSARKSGRPSKEYGEKLREAKRVLSNAGEPLKRALVRKNKPADTTQRPRGRPKKLISTIIKEKKPRGRPKKLTSAVVKDKLPRGRPRKHPPAEKSGRPRGRPRKNPAETPIDESKKKKA